MTMLWWHWVVLGLLLAGLELATPGGFFLIFFGVAGIIVGLLTLVHLAGPPWMQWLFFSALSIAAVLLFRNPLLRRMHARASGRPPVDALTRETATTLDEIPPGATGRVELRGTAWSAKNVGPTLLLKGERVAVQRVDGLTLHVHPEGAR